MQVFRSAAEALDARGTELGPTDWVEIPQQRIDDFARATDDRQWIHVDPERASRGPFGRTVAHGYLTLSLIPSLATRLVSYEFGSARLNYGLDRVRFPAPVPVGSRVRGRVVLTDVRAVPAGTLVAAHFTVDLERSDRPACVADTLTLLPR